MYGLYGYISLDFRLIEICRETSAILGEWAFVIIFFVKKKVGER